MAECNNIRMIRWYIVCTLSKCPSLEYVFIGCVDNVNIDVCSTNLVGSYEVSASYLMTSQLSAHVISEYARVDVC